MLFILTRGATSMVEKQEPKLSSLPAGHKRVNFNAPTDLMERFEKLVESQDRSVAWMLRKLIEETLKKAGM
jgi:hypothetical protein